MESIATTVTEVRSVLDSRNMAMVWGLKILVSLV